MTKPVDLPTGYTFFCRVQKYDITVVYMFYGSEVSNSLEKLNTLSTYGDIREIVKYCADKDIKTYVYSNDDDFTYAHNFFIASKNLLVPFALVRAAKDIFLEGLK